MLRIIKAQNRGLGFSQEEHQNADSYLSRVVKLIPGEVMGLYTMAENIIPEDQTIGLVVITLFCAVSVVIIRANLTKDQKTKKSPQWIAVMVSLISFLIWVYCISSLSKTIGIYQQWVGTITMACWSFIIPWIYKGDEPD